MLGGGPAGIAAAAAAARRGSSTLLVERYGFLGGAGTIAGLSNFCGLHAKIHGEHRQVVHGVIDDLLARLRRFEGLAAVHPAFGGKIMAQAYDTAAFKLAADDLLQSAGAKILFHALAVGVAMRGDTVIDALLIESKSGREAIRARAFIDCSGDADLARWAGAPFEHSNEPGATYYTSHMFRMSGVDPDAAAGASRLIPQLMAEAERRGEQRFPRKGVIVNPVTHDSECYVNATQTRRPDGGALDATNVDDLSYGEVEGRRQIWQVFDFIHRHVPGFERAYIVDIPPQIGIRETRRIVGRYQLCVDDVMNCVDFPDAIGVNGWPVEAHVAGDVMVRFPTAADARGFYQLPFRMIVPQRIENLYVAGRCASMTHEGQSSARVSGPCYVMGQAAGTAADQALKSGVSCPSVDVAAVQRQLRADGVYFGSDGR
ncbi:MAG TPA: FAD-dependent oxidoreductase [Xanthobacteraceae bacterium]|nr:FAD-dependent oxidoreductase [Xanthobacteraceae bacterium]